MTTSKLYHNSKCFDMSFVSLFPARSAMRGNFSFLLENALAFFGDRGLEEQLRFEVIVMSMII